jgi:hypothetical protein
VKGDEWRGSQYNSYLEVDGIHYKRGEAIVNVQRIFAVGSALAVGPGLYILYRFPPTSAGFYPPCLLHAVTGLHCPGCGMTRCVHSLLHGDVAQAFAYNALFVVFIPLLLISGFRLWYSCLTNRKLSPDRTPNWVCSVLLVVILIFAVLRNLPFHPFNLLAPHTL